MVCVKMLTIQRKGRKGKKDVISQCIGFLITYSSGVYNNSTIIIVMMIFNMTGSSLCMQPGLMMVYY